MRYRPFGASGATLVAVPITLGIVAESALSGATTNVTAS